MMQQRWYKTNNEYIMDADTEITIKTDEGSFLNSPLTGVEKERSTVVLRYYSRYAYYRVHCPLLTVGKRCDRCMNV